MKLQFQMQTQGPSNWCWAAVSASVSAFFKGPAGPSGGPWKQCELANRVFLENSCCVSGTSEACNQDCALDEALNLVGHLAGDPIVGASSLDYVVRQIGAQNPVGVRIGWYKDNTGHFVAITGYDDTPGSTMIFVDDPHYGPSQYDIAAFTNGYESGTGHWTHTYPIA